MSISKSQNQLEPNVTPVMDGFAISVFETKMGWLAIAGKDGVLTSIKILLQKMSEILNYLIAEGSDPLR